MQMIIQYTKVVYYRDAEVIRGHTAKQLPVGLKSSIQLCVVGNGQAACRCTMLRGCDKQHQASLRAPNLNQTLQLVTNQPAHPRIACINGRNTATRKACLHPSP